MEEGEITVFLLDAPEYKDILMRAIEHEESNKNDPNYKGWEWSDVRAYPAKLTKLVVEGIVKINFKSNKSTCYLLEDRDEIRKGVQSYLDQLMKSLKRS